MGLQLRRHRQLDVEKLVQGCGQGGAQAQRRPDAAPHGASTVAGSAAGAAASNELREIKKLLKDVLGAQAEHI